MNKYKDEIKIILRKKLTPFRIFFQAVRKIRFVGFYVEVGNYHIKNLFSYIYTEERFYFNLPLSSISKNYQDIKT